MFNLKFLLGLCLVCIFLINSQAIDKSGLLVKFDSKFNLKNPKGEEAKAELSGSTENPTLKITTMANKSWPGYSIKAPKGAWDLSDYEYLSVDILNVDDHDIELYFRIDNPGANGSSNCITERTGIQPGQQVTLTIPLNRKSDSAIKLFGMRRNPQGLYSKGGLDVSNITALVAFTSRTAVNNSFELSNIRVFGDYKTPKWVSMSEDKFFPFIDMFGQFIHKSWVGKIETEADLKRNLAQESAAIAASPTPKGWNKWGGWADGPQLKATGSFRTEKYQDKWYLVDPDGKLFFSTGLCLITTTGATTPIEDREKWFANLPERNSDLGSHYFTHSKIWSGHYSGRAPLAYNFSSANLQRKYGKDWKTIYPKVVNQRLRYWGINSMGNWSSAQMYKLKMTPYTTTFWYNCPKINAGSKKFPDVFDAKFKSSLQAGFATWELKSTYDDPWCIGYFVDNELTWGGVDNLARKTLACAKSFVAKQTLADFLKKRYNSIEKLNKAWATKYSSWDNFLAEQKSNPTTQSATSDLTDFTTLIAKKYFQTIREVIKEKAPNRLYLGCRSVGNAPNIVAEMVKYCDVNSFNVYAASVRNFKLLNNLDAPILIGEFHFGGLDRGLFWGGLFSAKDQNDRAKKLTEYLKSALDNPLIVGAHWFQYGDEATTGRGMDGENAQCGFVDVCDTPYQETIEASRAMADQMYDYRLKK